MTPKIVQFRLVADDEDGAKAALYQLKAAFGPLLQSVSGPEPGRTRNWRVYGQLLVSGQQWIESETDSGLWHLVDTTTGSEMAYIRWNDPWFDATISHEYRAKNSPTTFSEDSLEQAKQAVEKHLR